jgi:CelD/BcsL family acetyltransferase involved in cellulose biosynthesis
MPIPHSFAPPTPLCGQTCDVQQTGEVTAPGPRACGPFLRDTIRHYHANAFTSIESIEGEWLALQQRTPNSTLFQSLAWCRAWIESMAQAGISEEVRLVTVRSSGRIALLWPLAVRRLGPCRILHALAEPATQYCDALVDHTDDRSVLVAAAWDLIRSWNDIDILELRRVRDDASIMSLPIIAQGRSLTTNLAGAPFIDNGPTAYGLATQRTTRTRNALWRHQRKLAEHGTVAFEVVEDPADKTRTLAEGVEFKRQWIEQRGLWSDGYSHPGAALFSEALARRKEFMVTRLTVGGDTAAVEAGFVIGTRYWSLMQSYDARLASHGPGRLLLWHFILRSPQVGINQLDFLAPSYAHKREWSNGEMPVRDHLIALTMRGSIMIEVLLRGRPTVKRLYGLLPLSVRRHVLGLVGF